MSLVSCLSYHVSCLTSPVSRLLSHISCLTSLVSYLLSHISYLMSPVSHILSHVSRLTSSVSHLLSHVFCLTSPVSRLLYHVFCLTCLALCPTMLNFLLGTLFFSLLKFRFLVYQIFLIVQEVTFSLALHAQFVSKMAQKWCKLVPFFLCATATVRLFFTFKF